MWQTCHEVGAFWKEQGGQGERDSQREDGGQVFSGSF